MSIRSDICDAMDRSGVTMYRIAKDTGLNYTTLYNFYHGRTGAHLETLQYLVDYLDLQLQPIVKPKRKPRK
jgi:DNA-binding phage protein